MNAVNYQKELDQLLSGLQDGKRPKLLLHSCCAPCSSYCLTYLSPYFDITVFYYNPNITEREEYEKRVDPHKQTYYWLTGNFNNFEPEAQDTDEWALQNNYAAVVPIQVDFTAFESLKTLKSLEDEK